MKDVNRNRWGQRVHVAVRLKKETGLPASAAIVIGGQSLKAREQTDLVNLLQSQFLDGPAKALHDIARSFREGLSFGNKRWTIGRGGDLDRSCRRTHGTEALGQLVMKHPCEVTPFLLAGFHQTSRQV